METKLFYGTLRKAVHVLNQKDLEKAVVEFCEKDSAWIKGKTTKVTFEFNESDDGKLTCEVHQQVVEIKEE